MPPSWRGWLKTAIRRCDPALRQPGFPASRNHRAHQRPTRARRGAGRPGSGQCRYRESRVADSRRSPPPRGEGRGERERTRRHSCSGWPSPCPFLAQNLDFHARSPMRRLASSRCFSTGSFARSLRAVSIPANARSRHCSSRYIGAASPRDRASTDSPPSLAQHNLLFPPRRPALDLGRRAGRACSRATLVAARPAQPRQLHSH